MTVPSTKRCLRYIFGCDAYLVIATPEIDLTEILRTLETIEEFVNTRQRIAVLDGHVVECTVVDTHAHLATLLLHEENRCAEW